MQRRKRLRRGSKSADISRPSGIGGAGNTNAGILRACPYDFTLGWLLEAEMSFFPRPIESTSRWGLRRITTTRWSRRRLEGFFGPKVGVRGDRFGDTARCVPRGFVSLTNTGMGCAGDISPADHCCPRPEISLFRVPRSIWKRCSSSTPTPRTIFRFESRNDGDSSSESLALLSHGVHRPGESSRPASGGVQVRGDSSNFGSLIWMGRSRRTEVTDLTRSNRSSRSSTREETLRNDWESGAAGAGCVAAEWRVGVGSPGNTSRFVLSIPCVPGGSELTLSLGRRRARPRADFFELISSVFLRELRCSVSSPLH